MTLYPRRERNAIAENILNQTKIDCILLDYNLPDGTAIEFISKLKSDTSKLFPIIIIFTGDGDELIAVNSLKSGAMDYLVKDRITPDILYKSIRHSFSRRESEDKIEYLATYDSLTNLPNRFFIEKRIKNEILKHENSKGLFGVLFLDLDGFKQVNDTEGHHIGDCLLIEVAKRLISSVRSSDIVARFGGDEFVILITDVKNEENIDYVASNVVSCFQESFHISKHKLKISVSIGVSIYPNDSEDFEALIKNADSAMYEAKSLGKSRYQFFSKEMHDKITQEFERDNGVSSEDFLDKFFVCYQPIVDVAKQDIQGYEALLRLKSDDEILLPKVFLNSLENTRRIVEVGYHVINDALRFSSEKQSRVSINISAKQLKVDDFLSKFQQLMADYNVPPENIDLEITESILLDNDEHTKHVLSLFHDIGCKISIDDFGIG